MAKRFDINNVKDMKAAIAKLKGDHDLMVFDGKWWIYDDSEEITSEGFYGLDSDGGSKLIKYKQIDFAEII